MKGMNLDLAVSYTPPGSDLSMTLATIRDAALLAAVLKIAIADADAAIRRAANPLAVQGLKTQRAYLAGCLSEILGQQQGCPAGVM